MTSLLGPTYRLVLGHGGDEDVISVILDDVVVDPLTLMAALWTWFDVDVRHSLAPWHRARASNLRGTRSGSSTCHGQPRGPIYVLDPMAFKCSYPTIRHTGERYEPDVGFQEGRLR